MVSGLYEQLGSGMIAEESKIRKGLELQGTKTAVTIIQILLTHEISLTKKI